MWKSLAKFGWTLLLASPVLAADFPAPNAAQPLAPPSFGSPPLGNTYADPFFAPPGGMPVMDPSRPGSGAAAADTFVPPSRPFRSERLWVAGDFYFAAGQGTLLPPLVTTAPAGQSGALNQPTTTTLFGGERKLQYARPGLRATAGIWLTEDYRFGFDTTLMYLADRSSEFTGTATPGGPILARPLTIAGLGLSIAVPVGTFAPGTLSARAHTAVIGGDANFRYGLTTSELGRLDLLVGYRYGNLRDTVDVESRSQFAANPIGLSTFPTLPSLDFAVSDHFRTLNQFNGAQVGLGGTHRLFDRLTLTTKGTVAIGVNISDVTISEHTFTVAGLSNGGLLTGNNNIGTYRENQFAVVPEGSLKLGWDFTDRFRVNAGYSFLYWTKVRRAADQIDTTIQAGSRPAFRNYDTDYWIQGWTVGLDLRW